MGVRRAGSGWRNSVWGPDEVTMKSESCQPWTKYTHIQHPTSSRQGPYLLGFQLKRGVTTSRLLIFYCTTRSRASCACRAQLTVSRACVTHWHWWWIECTLGRLAPFASPPCLLLLQREHEELWDREWHFRSRNNLWSFIYYPWWTQNSYPIPTWISVCHSLA